MSTKKNRNKKKSKYIVFIIIILLLSLIGVFTYKHFEVKIKEEKQTNLIKKINASFNNFVITKKDSKLYDSKGNIVGDITKDVYLVLESIPDNYDKEYFKLKNSNLYIKYTDIDKIEEKSDSERYKNYIPFNKSIVTDSNLKLYITDNTYYKINTKEELPIIIEEEDKYYTIFDDKLVSVNKDECKTVDASNSTETVADSIAVLNYHFVINKDAGEDKICEPSSICHTDAQFESHIKYIKENNIFAITMKELEQFIDGKINLPKKSVAITIDDGWFVYRSRQILNDYKVMGTLFLIGNLAPVSDYASDYLEVHSHTWNLHNVSNCSEGRSPLLCYDKAKIVEDLKKSRESLNNTTYFCYPFYEYNDHAIEALKEAGFTMALTGNNKKVTKGINKFKVPRYVIYNTTTVDKIAKMIG